MFKGGNQYLLYCFCSPPNKRYRCRGCSPMSHQLFCNDRQITDTHYKAKCIYRRSKSFPMDTRYRFCRILMTCYHRKGCGHSSLCYRDTCISRRCDWRCYAWHEFKWYTGFTKSHRFFTATTKYERITAF